MFELIEGVAVDEETFKEMVRQLTDFKLNMQRFRMTRFNSLNLSDLNWVQTAEVSLSDTTLFESREDYKDNVDNVAIPYLVGFLITKVGEKMRRTEVVRIEFVETTQIGVIYDG